MDENDSVSIPSGWIMEKISNICRVYGGGTPSREKQEYFGGKTIWLTPTEIPKEKITIITDSKEKITDKGLKNSSAVLIPKNSVLLTTRATIGSVAIAGKEVTTNQGFASLVCSQVIYNKYLGFWLFGNKPVLHRKAKGTTFKEISKSELKGIEIPIPPLDEQKRIVSKLEELFSKLDAGIEYLKKTQIMLKQYRQSVLKHAFEGKLTSIWRKNNPVDSEQLIDLWKQLQRNSEFRDNTSDYKNYLLNSDSWLFTKLGHICKLVSGQHILEENYNRQGRGIPYITGPADFQNIYPVISKWTDKPKSIAEKNDVLITVKGAGVGKINILNIEKTCISRQVMAIRTKFDPLFVFYYLLYNFNKLQKLGVGSTVPGIDRQSLLLMDFLMPPLEEQNLIVLEIEKRFSIADMNYDIINRTIRHSSKLRQSILKNAFEGKIVPHYSNDESASLLLGKMAIDKPISDKPKAKLNKHQTRLI